MLETAIIAAFTFFNTARLVSYLPQLLVIARDSNGATAVSYLTWTLWVCANISASAYAGVIAGDVALCFIYAMNGFFCLVTIALTAYKRWEWRCQRSGHGRLPRLPPTDAHAAASVSGERAGNTKRATIGTGVLRRL
ncbi:MAG TPA: hypothetical protein VFV47_08680 [Hyphomicrobiaceae bacterium]|nr:hypothetical protein [Hyphomicrobiaceae bacterium]